MSASTSTVILAYAHYVQYLGSLSDVVAVLCRRLKPTRVVVVTTLDINSVAAVFRQQSSSTTSIEILSHDNQSWEFGGYQRGLDALKSGWRSGDALVVLNDTVGCHSVLTGAMLRAFEAGVRQASIATRPTIVGEVDSGAAGASIRGLDASRWLRSCLFAINTPALSCLDWTISCPDLAKGLYYSSGIGLVFPNTISEDLADSINGWLFKGRQGARWYRASIPETPSQEQFIVQKALSILNEKYLSARVLNTGVAINIFPETPVSYAIYRFWRKWSNLKRRGFP